MDYRTGFRDGYNAGRMDALNSFPVAPQVPSDSPPVAAPTPKKRKVSAYNRRYSAAYKRIRRKNTLKNGSLRKGYNHKRIVKLAHAEAKKGGRS